MKIIPPAVCALERELIIKLAPVYLACRWRVMGHGLIGRQWPKPDLAFDLLGMCDYGMEMRMVVVELKQKGTSK